MTQTDLEALLAADLDVVFHALSSEEKDALTLDRLELADAADEAGQEMLACWLRLRACLHQDSCGFRSQRGEGEAQGGHWVVIAYSHGPEMQAGRGGIAQWIYRDGKWHSPAPARALTMTQKQAEAAVREAAAVALGQFFRLDAARKEGEQERRRVEASQ